MYLFYLFFNKSRISVSKISSLVGAAGSAGAFEDREFIEGVYIPNSVEIMGEYVFYNCFALKEVFFQEGSRLSGYSRCIDGSRLEYQTQPVEIDTTY